MDKYPFIKEKLTQVNYMSFKKRQLLIRLGQKDMARVFKIKVLRTL